MRRNIRKTSRPGVKPGALGDVPSTKKCPSKMQTRNAAERGEKDESERSAMAHQMEAMTAIAADEILTQSQRLVAAGGESWLNEVQESHEP
jgi:hypothetical protein